MPNTLETNQGEHRADPRGAHARIDEPGVLASDVHTFGIRETGKETMTEEVQRSTPAAGGFDGRDADIDAVNPIFAMQASYGDRVPVAPATDEFAAFDADDGAYEDLYDSTYEDPYGHRFESPYGDAPIGMPAANGFRSADASAMPSQGMPRPVAPEMPSPIHALKDKAVQVVSAPKNNILLTIVFYALVALYAAWDIFGTAYDNDIWFIMATGEEIMKNGIPYTNPFSLHEDMGIVVQQWLPCVISYLIYGLGGFVALGAWVLVLFVAMAFSFYKVGRILRNDSYGSELIALVFVPLTVVMSTYASVRPHLYTMIAFIWIIGLLTLYRRTSKIAYIIPLPFIVALHVNFQASMAPFDIVIMVCYLIPNFLKPLHERGRLEALQCIEWDYKRLPLLIVALASIVALLANPYLLDGALYLVKSFGSASYRDYISEMNPLVPASHWVYITALLIFVAAAIVVGAQGSKLINFPLLLLMVGTTALSFTQIRNIWLGPLFCALYLVSVSSHHCISLWMRAKAAKVLSCVAGALATIGCCLLIAFEIPAIRELPANDSSTPVAALDYLDEIGADKDRTRILNFFNSGGYFEYRGYKVVMDPRPELWAPSITGLSFDYYKEFVDMTLGDTYIDDYIAKYDLNVYVVDKTDASVDIFKNQEIYLEISGGSDYRAFIKRDAYEYITGKDISTAPKAVRYTPKNATDRS